MIFKTRNQITRAVEQISSLGFDNLIVGGCSFTYNNSETDACTWPYYLRDLAGFQQVLDCSLPGAGNAHIANSLKWALEIDQPDPATSLIVVMWSGNNRDDYVCPDTSIGQYPMRFDYTKHVSSGITGGNHVDDSGNMLSAVSVSKTRESRAVENYLYIVGLYHYLMSKKYQFVFVDYLDRDQVTIANDFEISGYLPRALQNNLSHMIAPCTDLYKWAAGHNALDLDQFHPSPDAHLSWTREILLPLLNKLNSNIESPTLRA